MGRVGGGKRKREERRGRRRKGRISGPKISTHKLGSHRKGLQLLRALGHNGPPKES